MKVVAYVEKIVPVEVEVDDKWKPMEEYGNTPWKELTGDQDGYFEENQNFTMMFVKLWKKLEKVVVTVSTKLTPHSAVLFWKIYKNIEKIGNPDFGFPFLNYLLEIIYIFL